MRFKLVVAFVDPEITEEVVKAAKDNGATGDVIIPARGSGMQPASFMGLSIKNKTDVVLFVVEEHCVNKIMDAINQQCELDKPGNGIVIALGIDKVAGLSKQIEKIREKLKTEQL